MSREGAAGIRLLTNSPCRLGISWVLVFVRQSHQKEYYRLAAKVLKETFQLEIAKFFVYSFSVSQSPVPQNTLHVNEEIKIN
jgi:hypothetical protein